MNNRARPLRLFPRPLQGLSIASLCLLGLGSAVGQGVSYASGRLFPERLPARPPLVAEAAPTLPSREAPGIPTAAPGDRPAREATPEAAPARPKEEGLLEGTSQGRLGSRAPRSLLPPPALVRRVEVYPTAERLPLQVCAGQMLMIGISGPQLTPGEARFIREHGIGGVILFGSNIKSFAQVKQLTNEIQAAALAGSGIPALIAVDQEGGSVVRLKANTGMPSFPAAREVASPGDLNRVTRSAVLTGHYLRRLGINMNLAPVLDVVTRPERGVIGDRSFSSRTDAVEACGVEYIRALQSQGVIATAKHFPGHGPTTVDSHVGLPVVTLPQAELQRVHVAPFQAAIDAGVGAMMSAHIVYPTADPSGLPATLSPHLMTEVLRTKMGFRGVTISDSMTMGAVRRAASWGPAVRQAALAGIDILLIDASPQRQRLTLSHLTQGAKQDSVLEARIRESAGRILDLKVGFQVERF